MQHGNKYHSAAANEEPKQTRLGIRSFSALYFTMVCGRIILSTYFNGVARTIERRFGLRTRTMGMIGAINDIVLICLVLIIGYFGKRLHIPRILSVCAVLMAISAVCTAMPFFVFGPLHFHTGEVTDDLEGDMGDLDDIFFNSTLTMNPEYADWTTMSPSGQSTRRAQLCKPRLNDLVAEAACLKPPTDQGESWDVLMWFIIAQIFSGFSVSASFVLGISYIDANAPKEKLPIYLAFLNSSYSIAPIFGFGLAAVTTMQPESLFASTLARTDPRWIGCWWLGFLVVALVEMACAGPLFFHPRTIAAPSSPHTEEELHMKPPPSVDVIEAERLAAKLGHDDDRSSQADKHASFCDEVTRIPAAVKQMLGNKLFVLMLCINVCGIYLIIGMFMNLARYLEIHFRLPAATANILVGLLMACSSAIGTFLGGIIVRWRHMSLATAAKFATLTVTAMLIGSSISMTISCPQTVMAGVTGEDMYQPMIQCSSNCSCTTDRRTYQPVCGTDGLTYFSPCHAGCSGTGPNMTFTDCQCLAGGDGVATTGLCDGPCYKQLALYSGILLLAIFTSSLGRVPRMVVFLGIIPAEQKSFGLGISSFCTNLLGFIPAPIIMGHLVDQTCILWQKTCGIPGSCLLYDTTAFRYLIHGITIIFGLIDLFFMIILSVWLHRKQQRGTRSPISDVIVEAKQPVVVGDTNGDDDVDTPSSEQQALRRLSSDELHGDMNDNQDPAETAAEMSRSQSRILLSSSHPELTNF